MKKFFCLAACLVLVVSLSLPAFAWESVPPVPNPLADGVYRISEIEGSGYYLFVEFQLDQSFDSVTFTFSPYTAESGLVSYTFWTLVPYERIAAFASSSGSFTINKAEYPSLWSGTVRIECQSLDVLPSDAYVDIKVEYFDVSPLFENPINNGSYVVSNLFGVKPDAYMYTVKSQPKTFVFSDVTGYVGAKVLYAITAEGSATTYHDIGTLEDGFSFSSAEYPVASYFTVLSSNTTSVSFTVSVTDASIDKSSGIAVSIWDTCLTMGTAMITWITTGTNFIVLIPLVLFILAAAILFIRKLVKGV